MLDSTQELIGFEEIESAEEEDKTGKQALILNPENDILYHHHSVNSFCDKLHH